MFRFAKCARLPESQQDRATHSVTQKARFAPR